MKRGPDLVMPAGPCPTDFIRNESRSLGQLMEKVAPDRYALIFTMLCYDGEHRQISGIELNKKQFFEMADYIKAKIEELDGASCG